MAGDLAGLTSRLDNLTQALSGTSLTQLDASLALAAQKSIAGVRKPNFYKWSTASFATGVRAGSVYARGGEWSVAERGRQGGRHGRTSGRQTWTMAASAASSALPAEVDRQVSAIVKKALGG